MSTDFLCASGKIQDKKNTNVIIDENGTPSATLKELLLVAEIDHDGSLPSIVNVTQKAWLELIRPNNKERWEINQEIINKFEKNREQFLKLFRQLDISEKLSPLQNHYTYAVLLGSTLKSFCKRLGYLIELSKAGIIFDELVTLAGERPLLQKENKAVFLSMLKTTLPGRIGVELLEEFPTNEADMMEYVLKYVELPETLRSSIVMIRVPMKINNTGALVRPTTADTVIEWLKAKPKLGSILALSSQPYCAYQSSVLKTFMPEFIIETVGKAAKHDTSIALYLDSLGRFLFQENKRLEI